MFDHAKALTTEELDRQFESENIKTALRQCGYPDWAFKAVKKKIDAGGHDQEEKEE